MFEKKLISKILGLWKVLEEKKDRMEIKITIKISVALLPAFTEKKYDQLQFMIPYLTLILFEICEYSPLFIPQGVLLKYMGEQFKFMIFQQRFIQKKNQIQNDKIYDVIFF